MKLILLKGYSGVNPDLYMIFMMLFYLAFTQYIKEKELHFPIISMLIATYAYSLYSSINITTNLTTILYFLFLVTVVFDILVRK
jgi:hypothetical protein